MNERLIWLLLALYPLPAFTQPRVTESIVVHLEGVEGCVDVSNASIVLRGKDDLAVPLTRTADGRWIVTTRRSLDAATEVASLRLHPGRTTCRRARPHRTDASGKPVAEFVFQCVQGRYRRIDVDLGEPVPFAYRRDVAPSPTDKESVACVEEGAFPDGEGSVTDIPLYREKIFIFPGFTTPDRLWSGILVSGLPPAVKKLSRADLAEIFLRQVAAGEASSAPALSDNWRVRIELRMKKRGVKSVDMAVRE